MLGVTCTQLSDSNLFNKLYIATALHFPMRSWVPQLVHIIKINEEQLKDILVVHDVSSFRIGQQLCYIFILSRLSTIHSTP